MKFYQIIYSIKIMFYISFIRFISEKARKGKKRMKRYSQLIKQLFSGMIVEQIAFGHCKMKIMYKKAWKKQPTNEAKHDGTWQVSKYKWNIKTWQKIWIDFNESYRITRNKSCLFLKWEIRGHGAGLYLAVYQFPSRSLFLSSLCPYSNSFYIH